MSALHSKSGTNVGPRAWHLLTPSSSRSWKVEWIRIFYLVANCVCVCVWSKTPQKQCKAPETPVSFGKGLLWPGAPGYVWAFRDKGWCHTVTPKNNTHYLQNFCPPSQQFQLTGRTSAWSWVYQCFLNRVSIPSIKQCLNHSSSQWLNQRARI